MKQEFITRNEIQTIATGDYFGMPLEELFLVYSPLAGASFIASRLDIERLEDCFCKKNKGIDIPDDMQEVIEGLTDFSGSNPNKNVIKTPYEFTKLSILPNFTCNFSCSYCYSAKGRSNKTVNKDTLQVVLDFFIDPARVKSKDLSIFISGGGEPLMSLDRLLFILEYGTNRAQQKGVNLDIALMTNGAKLTAEIIETLKKYCVNTGVSFDILEEVQNKYRGKYSEVAANIRKLIACDYPPSISAVITPDSVTRQVEMVEEIINKFSGIQHLNFDPVMASHLQHNVANELHNFYENFIENFFKARHLAHRHGITLDCNLVRKFQDIFPRYCQGKLCLTPEGKISICHSISSPAEKGYDSAIYGYVNEHGQLIFDEKNFSTLIARENNLNENCASCIAKWHCGGGCLMYRKNYTEGMFAAYCNFTRNIIKKMLLDRLDCWHRENYGTPLKDYVLKEQTITRNISAVRDISQLRKLSILPGYACNFNCTYCYSAKGRSDKKININKAEKIIDFFINKNRTELNELWLAILGGGEPLLSADNVGHIIKYARQRAFSQNIKLGIGLTTNGSIYNAQLSQIMKNNHVSLGVSFEVLKDVQNSQRQGYDTVCKVIGQYLNDGVDVSVKSIITPSNVERLKEMVEHLHKILPAVKSYKLQIVEDAATFADVEAMRAFYDSFSAHFFSAREAGEKYNVDVYVLASKYVDMLLEHYCGGEMCLTPEGTLSVCHRISSPHEPSYNECVYGLVDDDLNITIDHDKFRKLMSHDVHASSKCRDCSAKWHCGGGCLAQAYTYDENRLNIICDWTRNFTKLLLERTTKLSRLPYDE